ncbi:hypothetical protein ACRALDRAFT_1059688 [Sodiomyces alcalophilus JCM 7366]|uniref:uncharacterized protein n=1 Tax=Sodiomyces alcalophilus JCM 7366 TaxID=591952 RepID=UPI0039B4C9D6
MPKITGDDRPFTTTEVPGLDSRGQHGSALLIASRTFVRFVFLRPTQSRFLSNLLFQVHRHSPQAPLFHMRVTTLTAKAGERGQDAIHY